MLFVMINPALNFLKNSLVARRTHISAINKVINCCYFDELMGRKRHNLMIIIQRALCSPTVRVGFRQTRKRACAAFPNKDLEYPSHSFLRRVFVSLCVGCFKLCKLLFLHLLFPKRIEVTTIVIHKSRVMGA